MTRTIKISPADKWFSLYIRARDGWTCQRCYTYYPDGKRQGLHCSHFHGRAKYATRYDEQNCEALCYGCHSYLTMHPAEHEARKRRLLLSADYDRLLIRAQDTKRGRENKRNLAQIAAYYRERVSK